MAPSKSVKKVEIADESIVDLKAKERVKPKINFAVHRIGEEQGHDENMGSFHEENHQVESSQLSSAELNDRVPRAPKYDADALQQRMESFAEKLERAVIKVSPAENQPSSASSSEPKDLIKVKFDKFVQLVASRDFLAVLERNKDEEIVLSSNLLTELAGAVEEKSEKKTPVIFLVGLAIGVIITYLLINR